MKYLAMVLATAALSGAQTPVVSIRPDTAGLGAPGLAKPGSGKPASQTAATRTGIPILGYLIGPGPLDLRAITGSGKSAHLGGPILPPNAAKHLFVPPRQHYLLVESNAAEPLAVWLPTGSDAESVRMPAAMPHPDFVTFSARGEAAVVYSRAVDRVQVISGLPGEPAVASMSGIAKFGDVTGFAVSDDGVAIVAAFADGTAIASLQGDDWQRVPAAFGASALLFVSNTHNLLLSDASQQTLTLLSNLSQKEQSARVLAQGVSADRLALTKEGGVLLAASSSQGKLWTVDLKTMTPEPVATALPAVIDTLLPLRDGHTFLLSSPGVSLLSVPPDRENAAVLVPVTR